MDVFVSRLLRSQLEAYTDKGARVERETGCFFLVVSLLLDMLSHRIPPLPGLVTALLSLQDQTAIAQRCGAPRSATPGTQEAPLQLCWVRKRSVGASTFVRICFVLRRNVDMLRKSKKELWKEERAPFQVMFENHCLG